MRDTNLGSSTANSVESHFQHIGSCLDYQGYLYRIDPGITAPHYTAIRQHLATLGKTKEERMGVTYVYASWGFCIIPCYGFPELRLNFYHETSINDIENVMTSIHAAFETSDVTVNPGD